MKQVYVQRAYMKRTRFCEYDMKGVLKIIRLVLPV